MNVSSDSIRYSVRAPSSRSLMDSRVELQIPVKIKPRGCTQWLNSSGLAADLNQRQADADGVQRVPTGGDNPDAGNLAADMVLKGPGVGKNLAIAPRYGAIWEACSSVVISINGQSTSFTTDQWFAFINACLMTEEEEGLHPEGRMDGRMVMIHEDGDFLVIGTYKEDKPHGG